MKKEAGNILLAGVGAAALTIEKASDIITGWVKKGKLTVEDGKELTEELKRNILHFSQMQFTFHCVEIQSKKRRFLLF